MAAPAKPRHRSGYSREETEQVEAACLTVVVTLGALMDRLCIVGGLVPSLLIDREFGPEPETGAGHPARTTSTSEPETLGPRRVAEFEGEAGEDLDAVAADAHGYVDDLLKTCAQSGLWRASKQDRGETL